MKPKKEVKARNWNAVDAHFRNSAGSMKDRRSERGGTKNDNREDDEITSRILWLDGLESGFNNGGVHDSYTRYIYIHGTSDEMRIGQPVSHGCIRMKNLDVIELFDEVLINDLVIIQ